MSRKISEINLFGTLANYCSSIAFHAPIGEPYPGGNGPFGSNRPGQQGESIASDSKRSGKSKGRVRGGGGRKEKEKKKRGRTVYVGMDVVGTRSEFPEI